MKNTISRARIDHQLCAYNIQMKMVLVIVTRATYALTNQKPKRIAIVGSRQRDTAEDFIKVAAVFNKIYVKGDTIVSGGCPKGGDRFAELIAAKLKIHIKLYRPDWSMGRHAGFVRNTDIAMHSDVLIACVTKYRAGGTEDTIKKFRRLHPDSEIHLVR